jgi:hypothetical protein
METMTATQYSSAPTSTRTVPGPDSSQYRDRQPTHSNRPTTTTTTTTTSPSLSQGSIASVQSSSTNGNIPELHTSPSNLSQLTNNTDLTEPDVSSQPAKLSHIHRDRTPDNATFKQNTTGDSALASPMSIASPVVPTINGSKRTASGHVKNAASLSTPSTTFSPMMDARSRRESTTSSGSRAGELAASLKERLGYAMAKVQHGWEHKSLLEVEQLAANRERSSRATNRYSASYIDNRPLSSGLSNPTANMTIYESMYANQSATSMASPPSKRRSGHFNFSPAMSSSQQSANSYLQHTPRLEPALDLTPTCSSTTHQTDRKQNYSQPTPSSAMSPPRTPIPIAASQRPPTLRTQTQTMEAERDAIMVLQQLGSPRTVGREDSAGSMDGR